MKYLRELIKKLNENQFNLLLEKEFSNTEKTILNFYRNSKEITADNIISKQIDVKISTLKKLQSKLVTNVVEAFSSNDIFDKINFLSKNNCHRLLLHLARKEMKFFEDNNDIEKLTKLCLTIPSKMLNGVISEYKIEEILEFRDKYYSLDKNKPKDVEAKKLDIIVLILEGQQMQLNKDEAEKYKKKIDQIKIGDNKILEFWKNKLLGEYYSIIGNDSYFEKVKDNFILTNEHPKYFTEQEKFNCKLNHCFYLQYNNDFLGTYNILNEFFTQSPKKMKSGLRYVDLMSQVCISLGKYKEAREIILKYYPIENDKPDKFAEIYFGNTTILAMIDIIEGKMDAANKKILAANRGLEKQYFLFLDCLLRIVEQAYYLQIKDYDFSDTLHKKNIKFYQYHKDKGLETLENTHKLLQQFSKLDFSKNKLSPKYIEYQKELSQGDYAFLGHFIERLNPNFS